MNSEGKRLSRTGWVLIILFAVFFGFMAALPFQAWKIRRLGGENALQVKTLEEDVKRHKQIVHALRQALEQLKAEAGPPRPLGTLLTLTGHSDSVTSVCFSPDGKRIASSSLDMTVRIWDAEKGNELLTFRSHDGHVHGI